MSALPERDLSLGFGDSGELDLALTMPADPYVRVPTPPYERQRAPLPVLGHVEDPQRMHDVAFVRMLDPKRTPLHAFLREGHLTEQEQEEMASVIGAMAQVYFGAATDEYYDFEERYFLCNSLYAVKSLTPDALSFYDLAHFTAEQALQFDPTQQGQVKTWRTQAHNVGRRLYGDDQWNRVVEYRNPQSK